MGSGAVRVGGVSAEAEYKYPVSHTVNILWISCKELKMNHKIIDYFANFE